LIKFCLQFIICLVVALGFVFSCQSVNVKSSEIKLKPFLVSDSLLTSNKIFRKQNRFTPVIYGDNLIVANSFDGLVSYNKKTQSINWRFQISKGIESAGLAVSDNLFVGGLDGVFYSIDLDDGKLIWKFDTKSEIVSEPVLNKGFVYFLNGANALFALDASSGKQQWVYNRQETSTQMTVRGGGRPVIDNNIIYLGFSDGALVAVNIQTGTPQWDVLLNKNSRFKDIDANPVIDGDKIFINSYDDKLYCLSKSNGSLIWKSDFGGATAPVIAGDSLIYSTSKGHLVSVSKNEGKIFWTIKNISGIATEPVLNKNHVIVGESQGSLKLFNVLTGELLTSFDPGRGIASKPVVDRQQDIYFISGEANVYGLKIQSVRDSEIPYLVQ
jgi:outer membrane protein assembly factor BamB